MVLLHLLPLLLVAGIVRQLVERPPHSISGGSCLAPGSATVDLATKPLWLGHDCDVHLQVWNPCFDVTPAKLIEGIITEKGLLPKKNGVFDVPAFMQSQVISAVLHAAL